MKDLKLLKVYINQNRFLKAMESFIQNPLFNEQFYSRGSISKDNNKHKDWDYSLAHNLKVLMQQVARYNFIDNSKRLRSLNLHRIKALFT